MRKKIFILLFALALVLTCRQYSFAQGDPGDNSTVTQELNRYDNLANSTGTEEPAGHSEPALQEKLVTAMEVKGNKAISGNAVISKMKTKIGAPYKENIISDDLKRLYLLGFFDNIKIDTEDYKNGVKIIIKVVERPIIEKIAFFGIERLTMKDDKIKASLKSKETQYLDYPSLNEDVQALKKMYEKIGYGNAQVTYRVDIDKETNKAKVQFDVVEGKRIRIKDIIVKGNKNYPAGRIVKLMKNKRAWFFNAGLLKEEVLKEDIERIKSFYQRGGFADVAVDSEIKTDPKNPFLYIFINIEEGKKYLVGDITVKGNKEISEKDILAKLTECVTGKVFSQEALKQDIANIHGLYFDRGYISAQVQDATSLNPSSGRTDIAYNILENGISYVDKIKIRGNIKTKDVVVRRELRIKPGDRFDGDKLKRSKERLQNLGFFDEQEGIAYDVEDTGVPNKKDLIVQVKEAKTGTFSFGGGYSTVDKLVGFVEVEQKNFDWRNFPNFTGAGQDLKLRASLGSVSEGFDLSFTEPWVFDYPVSFGFDAYKNTHERSTDIGYGYDEDVTGGDLRLGKELSEYTRADWTYRYDRIKISNVSDDATNDLKKEAGVNNISSMELTLSYDSRDNVFYTTKGDILSGSADIAGGPFGGSKDFWKFYGRASHYFPMPRKAVIEVRGRIGLAKPYGDSDDVPIYERFFAGGASTVRGYHERKVGPIDPISKDPLGGESMMVGNIEYTYPFFDFLKGAVFYDVGNVWAKMSDAGSGGFKSGFGLGVRIKTPFGPLMLDYGIPLDKEPGEDSKGSGRLHFNVSHGF